MMKLLSIQKGERSFFGYVEDGDFYKSFTVTPNKVIFTKEFPKSNFRGYLHFVGVSGKFDPDSLFLRKPIKLPTLYYETLESVTNRFERQPQPQGRFSWQRRKALKEKVGPHQEDTKRKETS